MRNKRAYIAELIRSLAAAQNPGKELKFLELQFQADSSSSNGGGGMADDDMEDDEVEDLEEGQAAPLSRHVKVNHCCGSNYHPDADPDRGPSVQIKAQTLEKVLQ